jgi:hypothetical protein
MKIFGQFINMKLKNIALIAIRSEAIKAIINPLHLSLD